jgi:hypothetical protein
MMLDGKRCPRFIWRTTEDNDQAAGPGCEAFAWDEVRATAHETGGSLPVAGISPSIGLGPTTTVRYVHKPCADDCEVLNIPGAAKPKLLIKRSKSCSR